MTEELHVEPRRSIPPRLSQVVVDGTVAALPLQLEAALIEAVRACPGIEEEEGGIFMTNGEEYDFVPLRNANTGQPIAVGLYEVDRQQYAEKILPYFDKGWRQFASFHTHPTGCQAFPSGTDLTRLFNGFPTNFICSPSHRQLFMYKLDHKMKDGSYVWAMMPVRLKVEKTSKTPEASEEVQKEEVHG